MNLKSELEKQTHLTAKLTKQHNDLSSLCGELLKNQTRLSVTLISIQVSRLKLYTCLFYLLYFLHPYPFYTPSLCWDYLFKGTNLTANKVAQTKLEPPFILYNFNLCHVHQHTMYIKMPFWSQGKLSGSPLGIFSASMDTVYSYSQYQSVVFPHIIYSTGDYDNSTGVFTAPITAVYAFHIHIMGISSQHSFSLRVKRGSTILGYVGTGHDATNSGNSYERGSGTIVAMVQKDDKITLDAYYSAGSSWCSSFRLYGHNYYGNGYFAAYPIHIVE